MEVNGDNFVTELNILQNEVEGAAYIAIDCEFSGLLGKTKDDQDSLMNEDHTSFIRQFEGLRERALKYAILQIGLTFISFAKDGSASCTPYTINLTPLTDTNLFFRRDYCMETSSLAFLLRHGFDFQKQLDGGVRYLSKKEESFLYRKFKNQMHTKSEFISLDATAESLVRETKAQIEEWRSNLDRDGACDYLNVDTSNRYYQKVIHNLVESQYVGLQSISKNSFIQIRMSESRNSPPFKRQIPDADSVDQKKRTIYEKRIQLLDEAVGFRKLWDYLLSKRKRIICHNGLADLLFLFSIFEGDLPKTYNEFKNVLYTSFESVYDTKVLYTKSPLLRHVIDNGSSNLQALVEKIQITSTKISQLCSRVSLLDRGPYSIMMNRKNSHEAGKDAYDTAIAFLYYLNYTPHSDIEGCSNILFLNGQYLV
ncbi:triman, ribonuclease involved in priRNA formation Tri1 [Schizosaccharomyces osmophilus]|uniref:Triman, ribonuclease involved in priRNA formation Tri1 n=1 Tax=Schizosaccharomyces osmophilus TaxID=2545709 RepID=A0AAF0AXM6_9SCHI|nr:triman, ribonuclease involved in priRNA formation Tri1 [Schizosaccharomyces osmophilus]WBW74225.1 triman, ribonuclease involved in priRNA formation Tri1 [Schizosaccharomyces osmophilus]